VLVLAWDVSTELTPERNDQDRRHHNRDRQTEQEWSRRDSPSGPVPEIDVMNSAGVKLDEGYAYFMIGSQQASQFQPWTCVGIQATPASLHLSVADRGPAVQVRRSARPLGCARRPLVQQAARPRTAE
jgi:hypothetical protein